ncbi:leucine-rich repeat protein 1-like isoform X2 [Chelonus insularis]|nr:leucine-rich repeat protein 1-like isoform X2 [Chelonus insularis]
MDLHLKCSNVIELKSFLHVLKLGLDKKLPSHITPLPSAVGFKGSTSIPKKKITIKKKTDYPTLEGFPRTTEELNISGLDRKSFDRQILRLQSLRILNLSNNFIERLPTELGVLLPHLVELNLSQNRLGQCNNRTKWLWLNGVNITKSLRLLDLSSNQIQLLPNQIGKLKKLCTLNISNNQLKQLPSSIGNLTQLKFFDFSSNNINILPATIRNLHLDHLNVYGNFKVDYQDDNIVRDFTIMESNSISTLREFAARVVINNRFFYDASIIPYTLIEYLDNAQFCICGNACLNTCIYKIILADLRCNACNITSTPIITSTVPFFCTCCSISCFNRVSKTSI